jgi:hypothetical protein
MINNLLPLPEYAARIGLTPCAVRRKCLRGTLPGAVKIGRDWLIPSEAPYTDNRIISGKYKSWRKKAPEK